MSHSVRSVVLTEQALRNLLVECSRLGAEIALSAGVLSPVSSSKRCIEELQPTTQTSEHPFPNEEMFVAMKESVEDGAASWIELACDLNRQGFRSRDGKRFTAEALRAAYYREIEPESAKARAGR